MQDLRQLPGVYQVQPFHFFDPHHQPTRCELVVQPAQGWAVATELPDAKGAGLMYSLTTLAAKICQEYEVAPAQLTLFARYAYADALTGWYAVRFGHSDRDLFEGLRFLAPSRQEVAPEATAELLAQLATGQPPLPIWRALTLTLASTGFTTGKNESGKPSNERLPHS